MPLLIVAGRTLLDLPTTLVRVADEGFTLPVETPPPVLLTPPPLFLLPSNDGLPTEFPLTWFIVFLLYELPFARVLATVGLGFTLPLDATPALGLPGLEELMPFLLV